MGMLEKLETFINNLLIRIGDQFMRVLMKLISPKFREFIQKIRSWIVQAIAWSKSLPSLVKKNGPVLFAKIKSYFLSFKYKEKFQQTYVAAISQYKKNQSGAKISGLRTALLTPFLLMGQWLKGLSAPQAVLLLTFTSVSVLAGINMVFTSHRLIDEHMKETRSPASVEDEILYDRPDYYKEQSRHLEISGLRLPVYVANVNELRTIDIDFSATMTNRLSRMTLEKLEFQLRDHLVLNVEPMLASFPLEEEGKIIIREKLTVEIKRFMQSRQIEGDVKEIKLIYILAN
jgi:hypothetical protein